MPLRSKLKGLLNRILNKFDLELISDSTDGSPILSVEDRPRPETRSQPEKRPTPRERYLRALGIPPSITPSESASGEHFKRLEWEKVIKRSSKKSKYTTYAEQEASQTRSGYRFQEDEDDLEELPGSELDPPENNVNQSIRIVDEWFERCNKAMMAANDNDSDNDSLVSVFGGDVQGRPKLDVPDGESSLEFPGAQCLRDTSHQKASTVGDRIEGLRREAVWIWQFHEYWTQ